MDNQLTPMMRQYLDLKSQHPNEVLFYRLGDFYELFLEDAVKMASVLEIALTRRGKKDGKDIPMCGVPAHMLEHYMHKLIARGIKVAICEQIQDSATATSKIFQREVVRVITPGTITEGSLLEEKSNNYLLALGNEVKGQLSLAWVDISTGDFYLSSTDISKLSSHLEAISPGEIICSQTQYLKYLSTLKQHCLTAIDNSCYTAVVGEKLLQKFLGIVSLQGIADFSKEDLQVIGGLLGYIEVTQKKMLPLLKSPRICHSEPGMFVDWTARRSLELTKTIRNNDHKSTLIGMLDQTKTAGGGRLLRYYFATPLGTVASINQRLELVEFFYKNPSLNQEIREALKEFSDLERQLNRLLLRCDAPRDMLALANSLKIASDLASLLWEKHPALHQIILEFMGNNDLINEIQRAIIEPAPISTKDGNFIAYGYRSDLDEFRDYLQQQTGLLVSLECQYIQKTGVNNLKVKSNNLIGNFVEVGQRYANLLGPEFIHRQSTSNMARFKTKDIEEIEVKTKSYTDKIFALEKEIFAQLIELITLKKDKLRLIAQGVATLDVLTNLAYYAHENNWVRPVMDTSTTFKITAGWHPTVKASLEQERQFVTNDCHLHAQENAWIITGPNMAGKSTFLRQNAIIAFLAHIGSFVPAQGARIGIIDRLFSRVGAMDELSAGHSTFMVEMLETALILNQATERSLVILDELGRGTATYDGISLAWASVEYLQTKIKPRCLLATHYHELNVLADQIPGIANYSLKIKEWQEDIVFLYQVAAGPSYKSYGLNVAKLAGVPQSVIRRADTIMTNLYKTKPVK